MQARLGGASEVAAELINSEAGFFQPPDKTTTLHGDFRPENVLLRGGEVRLVHDFDFLHTGRAEEDVAYAALYFSGPPWFSGPRNWDRCCTFITAYHRAAREAGDSGLRPHLLKVALYWTVLRELSLSFELHDDMTGQLELLDDLRANVDAVVGACCED